MPLYPGDPLTPGVGATKDAKRLPHGEAKTITKIPVLPISYGDAQPLLAAIDGPIAPDNWRGALPITYHVGPGPAKVHLKVKSNWDIEAHLRRDRRAFPARESRPMGDSRQSSRCLGERRRRSRLGHGGGDGRGPRPRRAGEAGMEAEAHHHLLRLGWRRAGLLGSTEWVEEHADELRAARRGVYQFRHQRPRLSWASPVRTRWRGSSTGWRATSKIRRQS